jgi:hypothetical protein
LRCSQALLGRDKGWDLVISGCWPTGRQEWGSQSGRNKMGWVSDKRIRLRAAGGRSAVQGTAVAASAAIEHVGADHGGAHVAVPEQFLDGADVEAVFQQVGGEGMGPVRATVRAPRLMSFSCGISTVARFERSGRTRTPGRTARRPFDLCLFGR